MHKLYQDIKQIVTILFLIYRSFDELEAEMLQGQKLQVDLKQGKYGPQSNEKTNNSE